MRINHNIAALNTYRQLGNANAGQQSSMEKLSSGLRINNASDDAAGLAISEKMRAQVRGLDQASANAQDGISLIQTAEGALNETHSILQRMRELTVQSNNDTNTDDDRQAIQDEITQLVDEVDGIAQRTEFNGKNLLEGKVGLKLDAADNGTLDTLALSYDVDVASAKAGTTYTFDYTNDSAKISLTDGSTTQEIDLSGAAGVFSAGDVLNFDKLGVKVTLNQGGTFGSDVGDLAIDAKTLITEEDAALNSTAVIQIGANKNQDLEISIGDMSASSLGDSATPGFALDGVNVISNSFDNNLDVIDQAIKDVSAERSKLGAYQNRLDHTINNLGTSSENLTAAESRIRDVDMAKEMMDQTKNSILAQASQAMLAQANQLPQGVLQLLR
jgi:flagellin